MRSPTGTCPDFLKKLPALSVIFGAHPPRLLITVTLHTVPSSGWYLSRQRKRKKRGRKRDMRHFGCPRNRMLDEGGTSLCPCGQMGKKFQRKNTHLGSKVKYCVRYEEEETKYARRISFVPMHTCCRNLSNVTTRNYFFVYAPLSLLHARVGNLLVPGAFSGLR